MKTLRSLWDQVRIDRVDIRREDGLSHKSDGVSVSGYAGCIFVVSFGVLGAESIGVSLERSDDGVSFSAVSGAQAFMGQAGAGDLTGWIDAFNPLSPYLRVDVAPTAATPVIYPVWALRYGNRKRTVSQDDPTRDTTTGRATFVRAIT